jgi:hypothetical protein
LPEPYRVALYYAPEADDPLWQAGCTWLGFDPEKGAALDQPALPGLPANTEDPRRYGFHGTLKAPFTPRMEFEKFLQAATAFSARQRPFLLPRLKVTPLHGFLALCPAKASPELNRLAAACVMDLDKHRLPEDEAAQAKRAAGRTARQAQNIARWGYPLVLEGFRFHMTLTGKMENNPYEEPASAYFAAALAQPRLVKSIALFVEDKKASPFRLLRRLPFMS